MIWVGRNTRLDGRDLADSVVICSMKTSIDGHTGSICGRSVTLSDVEYQRLRYIHLHSPPNRRRNGPARIFQFAVNPKTATCWLSMGGDRAFRSSALANDGLPIAKNRRKLANQLRWTEIPNDITKKKKAPAFNNRRLITSFDNQSRLKKFAQAEDVLDTQNEITVGRGNGNRTEELSEKRFSKVAFARSDKPLRRKASRPYFAAQTGCVPNSRRFSCPYASRRLRFRKFSLTIDLKQLRDVMRLEYIGAEKIGGRFRQRILPVGKKKYGLSDRISFLTNSDRKARNAQARGF